MSSSAKRTRGTTSTRLTALCTTLFLLGISATLYTSSSAVAQQSDEIPQSSPSTQPEASDTAADDTAEAIDETDPAKTERIAGLALSRRYLDVCVRSSDGTNCSGCWKCARTLLTLEILGLLDQYDQVFDLDEYRRIRYRYISHVMSSDDTLSREIVELARARGFEFPPVARYYSWSRFVPLPLRAPARRLATRLGLG